MGGGGTAGVSPPHADRRVVIVGAGAAGDAAAEALRKAGFEGPVVLVGGDPHAAYHRPQLSKQFLRGELPLERVHLRQAEDAGAERRPHDPAQPRPDPPASAAAGLRAARRERRPAGARPLLRTHDERRRGAREGGFQPWRVRRSRSGMRSTRC
ncbi:MAG: FAD-dependent oxidoreductase [Candidatus Dormibacteraeota bacterium]|nr:FAD-dependent oxidoreductase [Candidatus Dormibacteraeota bacterium]